jgi:hypothetical protein
MVLKFSTLPPYKGGRLGYDWVNVWDLWDKGPKGTSII